MSSMIKALNSQLNYVKLYKRLIELICLKNNRSFRKKRISTLDFWWVFFLNDLKNTIRSFLFQMRNKIEQDLFLVNELSINWLLVSERRIKLLLMSKWETELLLTSKLRTELLLVNELKTELLLVSKLKTELLLSSEWRTELLLASELKTELLFLSEWETKLRKSYFVNFKWEIFFLLIKIIDLDEKWTTMIKIEKERQDENIVFKIDINDVIMKSWQIHDDEILI